MFSVFQQAIVIVIVIVVVIVYPKKTSNGRAVLFVSVYLVLQVKSVQTVLFSSRPSQLLAISQPHSGVI